MGPAGPIASLLLSPGLSPPAKARRRRPPHAEIAAEQISDDRAEAEVDGAYFGGYVKPANLKDERVDRRLRQNQSGKRKVVVVLRERGGETLPGVFKSES